MEKTYVISIHDRNELMPHIYQFDDIEMAVDFYDRNNTDFNDIDLSVHKQESEYNGSTLYALDIYNKRKYRTELVILFDDPSHIDSYRSKYPDEVFDFNLYRFEADIENMEEVDI